MTKRKRPGFTMLPDELFNDGLSFEQIGILSYYASHDKDWISNAKKVQKDFNIGKNQLSQKLGVLRRLGYLSRAAAYDKKTKEKLGTRWTFHYPPLSPSNRDLGKHPKSSFPVSPKQGLIRRPIPKGRPDPDVVDDDDRF